ncbi:MAG TPA: CHAP domain-containing protein [Rhizomicrobium sp.]|nr:CHAP domain-containing protein [Rhizomicrobium sp.]
MMGGVGGKLAVLGALALLSACASQPDYYGGPLPGEPGRNLVEKNQQKQVQCAPYAREHSQVKIFGDADTWWEQAAGRFARAHLPLEGSVMVLANYAGPDRGHVAVVRELVSAREIRVDHANWLDDGSIYVNDPVADVSAANDWSVVRVWNIKTGGWGTRVYPVQGFIGPGSDIGLASDKLSWVELSTNNHVGTGP